MLSIACESLGFDVIEARQLCMLMALIAEGGFSTHVKLSFVECFG